jgi:hypothetical protein
MARVRRYSNKMTTLLASKACDTYERIANICAGQKEFAEAADYLEEASASIK